MCLAVVDRTPPVVAALSVMLIASPLLWSAWSAVLARPGSSTGLDDRAFAIPEGPVKSDQERPPLVVPPRALTASLYQDLDPSPAQSDPVPVQEQVQTVTIQLVAITMNTHGEVGEGPSAFVFDTGRQEYTEVRAGDTIGNGATIRSIDQSGLVLELNGREIRVELDT